MFNVELTQELFKPPTIKLSIVIYDDRSGETIEAYYGFSDERFYLGFSDVGHGLGFDPFGEVIHCNKEKLPL